MSLIDNISIEDTPVEPADFLDYRIAKVGDLIADYTAWMLGCGATCVRLEKNTTRIAQTLGYNVCIFIMPKHVSITLQDITTGTMATYQRKVVNCGINFDLNSRLSSLSWKIADNGLSYEKSKMLFDKIVSKKYPFSWTTVFLTSLANASFCRLFGGDALAMLMVFIATFAGFLLKNVLAKHVDIRVVFIICAFVSTIISAGAEIFSLGATPDIAIATSVLYLIPGVPYINSASDLMERHYLCSMSRFMDACVLTICLSIGLSAGLAIIGITRI